MVFGLGLFASSDSDASASSLTTRVESIPLDAIPEATLEQFPELAFSPYDPSRGNMCSNSIAVPHNAVKLEMADMQGEILPSLQTRVPSMEDAADLARWWAGFARFALTTSIVDDYVMELAYRDILEDFDKDAQRIRICVRKFREKNTVTLEVVARAMGRAVESFVKRRGEQSFAHVVAAWRQFATTLLDIYALVEQTLHDIDTWRHDDIALHKDLERSIAAIYTNRKRWGADDSKRGEMIVLLTRWMGNEPIMREWMKHNLAKRDLRRTDRWMDAYRDTRLSIVDSFHQRYVA